LKSHDRKQRSLPGISDPAARETFLEQLLESIHRVRYVSVIRTRKLSERSADPNDEMFDPLKAALLHQRQEHVDEAFWLVFLFVHFGKHAKAGWRYAREVYGRLGNGGRWDWAITSADPAGFREWLGDHHDELKRAGAPHGFGNHRKYESLSAYSDSGTGAVVESYVRWVGPPRTHQELIEDARLEAGGDARQAFDYLYRSMRAVKRFGRTARFDYLTMVGKLGLAEIEPGSAYIQGSTGPGVGARLLFGGRKDAALSSSDLDQWLVELDAELNVGMQVLEDALCNWQKSPGKFERFRG
jgi:hypothetical protein